LSCSSNSNSFPKIKTLISLPAEFVIVVLFAYTPAVCHEVCAPPIVAVTSPVLTVSYLTPYKSVLSPYINNIFALSVYCKK